MGSDSDSPEDSHCLLRDTFFTPEEGWVSDREDELLNMYFTIQDLLSEGGHSILDRCSYPSFSAFAFGLHCIIKQRELAACPPEMYTPFALVMPAQGGMPEIDTIPRRKLTKVEWFQHHRASIARAHVLLLPQFPQIGKRRAYLSEFADFCFANSSGTK
jgi:hypothetical protein